MAGYFYIVLRMPVLFRSVSRAMLFVMLLTVFSPSFGWEAVSAMSAHHGPAVTHAGHDGHDQHGGHDSACPGCDDHAAAACEEQLHHCCPGHVLGHLPAGIGDAKALTIMPGGVTAASDPPDRYSSHSPEALERPPRSAA
jgi:hypothetical protein